MANTVIQLKKSGTPSATPASLANGELAINYADGKLFYKAANGTILQFASGASTFNFSTINANSTLVVADATDDVLSIVEGNNITIVGDAVNDKITIGLKDDVVIPSSGTFKVAAVGGNEGGEIKLGNAITNSVLTGDIIIDVYQNNLRFFESAGTNRGAYINLAAAGAGVGSDLLAGLTGTADGTARSWAGAAYDKANAANVLAYSALPNTDGVVFNGTLTASANLQADKFISTNNGNGENYKVGDDAWIGDTNIVNTVRIKGQQNSSHGYITFGQNDGKLLGRAGTEALTYDGSIVWTAGNDGAASGLDADLLDGQHGSYYSTATDSASAFAKANAALANATTTLAGTLTITDDLVVRGNATLGDASTDRITINGNSISLGNNQNIDAGTLFIDAVNNRVGIGTEQPNTTLTVASGTVAGASAFQLGIRATDGAFGAVGIHGLSYNALGLWGPGTTSSGTPQLSVGATTISIGRPISEYSTSIRLNPRGDIGSAPGVIITSGGTSVKTFAIKAAANQTSVLTEWQNSSGNSLSVVDANGNIGIGTSTPSSNLHVIGTSNVSSVLIVNSVNIAPTIIASFGQANLAYATANGAQTWSVAAFSTGNVAFNQANLAYTVANTANITADYAFAQANLAYDKANVANITADVAFGQSNLAYAKANSANITADIAFGQANQAYAVANSKFSANGGTINGDVSISGSLTVSGNTSFINVATYRVSDPLIYLAGNNYSSDIVDIGIIANYVNTNGQNVHTGVFRDAGTKEWYVFQEYNAEPENNVIDPAGNNFTIAVLNADIKTNNLWLSGINVQPMLATAYGKTNAAYAQANTANITADFAFNQANLAFFEANNAETIANTAYDLAASATATLEISYNQANIAYSQANTALTTGQAAFGSANGAYAKANDAATIASAAFERANTGDSFADLAWDTANAAFNRANTANITADVAFGQANLAYTQANAALANTTTTLAGTLTITNDLIVRGNATLGDASTDTITINGNSISLGNNQSIDSGTMFIDAVNNRVGIGTASPTVPLDVNGAITANGLVKVLNSSITNSDGSNDISQLSKSALSLSSTGVIRFANWTSLANPFDLILQRDDVGILGQRNGNSAQAYRLYNRYTDLANNERFAVQWQANTINISSEAYGTGSLRPIAFTMNTATAMTISTTGNVGIGTASPAYKLEVSGSFAAQTKSFVINHQTKAGAKLRYGSLEGPENGVYVRGKTTTNVIELPDYWQWLVDEDSITVTLTPIGKHQKLYVDKIENNKVYIKNATKLSSKIECFYMINAERKDVEKLIVEF